MVEATWHLTLDEAGRSVGARGTLRDVTGQRRLERAFLEAERFGSMFEVAPIATVFVDLEVRTHSCLDEQADGFLHPGPRGWREAILATTE